MKNNYAPEELLQAIHRAEATRLSEMLADGADVNAQSHGWSPAMQACGDGQLKCLRILIAAGADLNASGERGMTPLMAAVMDGNKSCLVALLKAGVDLEKKDDWGNTAAWFAAAYGFVDCLGRLFKAGVDLDACLVEPIDPSCADAVAAERARREKIALAKSASKPQLSVKSLRM